MTMTMTNDKRQTTNDKRKAARVLSRNPSDPSALLVLLDVPELFVGTFVVIDAARDG
jgi:hypothetical protein